MKQLESRIQETPKDKPLKKAVRAFRKDLLPRLQKYEVQQSKKNGDARIALVPPFFHVRPAWAITWR
ncbi:hypothetical protein ACFRAM_25540 [Paenibacillus sp. NPDC056722]|uniref:hypothetical protein n=1 Tax=Paenibacillus sp. NPDC056722 TaxID=3345924 RepID=UPI00368E7A2D